MASTPVIIDGAKTLVGYEVTPPFSTSDIFTFSFPYISQDDFEITVNSETVLDPSEFEFTSDYLIQLTQTGVDNLEDLYGTLDSVPFIIRRRTQVDERLVDFRDGATLTEADLDLAVDQLFYLLQEANDSTELGRVNFNLVDGSIDFDGAELGNIGEPTGENSAASFGTLLNNVITPDYTEDDRYRLHRMVFYNGDLYRANKDIDNAPAIFEPLDWDVVLTAAQLNQIGLNQADISFNAGNISTNASDIVDNANDIQTNAGNISTNAGNISTNSSDIATNAGNISTNSSDIATNAGGILGNLSWIQTNGNAHINANSAHGISGDVVGTTDVQDVSNKAIIDPSRLDVKKSTEADLIDYAAGTGVYTGNGPATNGQLCFATDSKAMYQVLDGALTQVGGGGLGSAQTLFILQADDESSVSDFTGKDALFDNGGTLDATSTLSLSTTASEFLTGEKQVFKYVAGSSALNDFFGYERAIPQGWRGRTLAFEFTYRTDSTYTDGDLVFQVKDSVGGDLLLGGTGLSLDKFESTDGNGKTIRGLVNIPSDASPIRFGFQNISSTSGIEFYFDKLSFDIDDFNYKNLNESHTIVYTNYLSRTGNFARLGTEQSNNNGGLISVDNTLYTKYIFNSPVSFTASASIGSSIPDSDWVIRLYDSSNNLKLSFNGETGASQKGTLAAVGNAEVGDFIVLVTENGHGGGNNTSTNFSVTANKISQHVVVNSGEDTTISVRAEGTTGQSVSFDVTDISFTEIADTANAFNGSTYTVQRNNSIVSLKASVFFNASATRQIELYKNGTRYKKFGDLVTNDVIQGAYISAVGEFVEGDILSFRSRVNGGTTLNDTKFHYLNITEENSQRGEYHLVPVSDQENVFSATITHPNTIDTQSSPFIESVVNTATGRYTINLKSGMFTVPPSVQLATYSAVADISILGNPTTSQIFVRQRNSDTTGDINANFNISVQRQGSDYQEPKVFLGDVPVNYFQTKILSGDVTTDTEMTDLTFNNLVVGRAYKISGSILLVNSVGGVNNGNVQVKVENGATIIGRLRHNFVSSTTEARINHALSIEFIAVDTTVTFTAESATTTSLVRGNTTRDESYATLTELNHTQETTRFT